MEGSGVQNGEQIGGKIGGVADFVSKPSLKTAMVFV